MIGGAISFGLHYALWRGKTRELWKNVEPVTMFITMSVLFFGVALGLVALGTYSELDGVLRKGLFQLVSGHTSTGYMTMYGRQLPVDWGALALLSLMIAMGLGGSTSSTAGGIKALRVAVSYKAFALEVRRLISPESAVIVEKYHHMRSKVLNDKLTRNALLIFTAYLLMFFGGAAVGMAYGYPFEEALFESTSAAANNGLTTGVTSVDLPPLMKIMYMVEMWFGRLEFLAAWALIGYVIAAWRGR